MLSRWSGRLLCLKPNGRQRSPRGTFSMQEALSACEGLMCRGYRDSLDEKDAVLKEMEKQCVLAIDQIAALRTSDVCSLPLRSCLWAKSEFACCFYTE